MKKKNIFNLKFYFLLFTIFSLALSCTKVDKGYLSPTMAYSVSQFTVIKGRAASSYSLISDGSTFPVKVKLLHVYDATGNNVDALFSKTYPVSVWTTAYDATTDKTFAQIMAKRSVTSMTPFTINESSGTIVANPSTIYLPLGTYTIDIQVSNVVGTKVLKNIMTIYLVDGKSVETSPEQGSYSLGRLIANTASGATNGASFNGVNNPFIVENITRVADTPNIVTFKFLDKNGVVFSPKKNEIMKRPNSGLNPNPAFLQNLQDYAPDTFVASDTAMSLRYPLVPFPLASLGNAYNMYYRLPTAFVHIDSTTTWSSNTTGNYYKGTSDTHFKGYFKDDKYDYSLRIPLRIQVPGKYLITLQFLNVTHRTK
jgi:hypothetical protein